jgi:hypothetical protein
MTHIKVRLGSISLLAASLSSQNLSDPKACGLDFSVTTKRGPGCLTARVRIAL